jgi:hypothetical protein
MPGRDPDGNQCWQPAGLNNDGDHFDFDFSHCLVRFVFDTIHRSVVGLLSFLSQRNENEV